MPDIVDKRPFFRGFPWTVEIADAVWLCLYRIRGWFIPEHDILTGGHKTRPVAVATGNYSYNSGSAKWLLAEGKGPLPTEIAKVTDGEAVVAFSSNMPTAAFDVFITTEADVDGKAVAHSYKDRTVAQVKVILEKNATGAAVNVGFSIEIRKNW